MKSMFRTGGALFLAALTAPLSAEEPAEDPAITRIKAHTAQLELEIKAHEASKSRSEAEAAAAAAKFGPLASHTTEGDIEVGTNSGKLEATLLAAEATRHSAGQIVGELCSLLTRGDVQACPAKAEPQSLPTLLVFTDDDKPNFDAYEAFKVQRFSIERDLTRALNLRPSDPRVPISGATFGPGAATALSVVGNLFRSDYKLAALDIEQADGLLVRMLLQEARRRNFGAPIIVPSLYSGLVDIDQNPAILALAKLEETRNQVSERADELRQQAKSNPKQKEELDAIVAKMDAAVQRFDDFATKLGTPDDKGLVPLSHIARQAMISNGLMNDSYFLILNAEEAGGSTYSKKNFWTFLGGIPFFVSGGSLVSYTLVKGRTGEVIHAGVIPKSQAFTRIDAASRKFLPAAGKN